MATFYLLTGDILASDGARLDKVGARLRRCCDYRQLCPGETPTSLVMVLLFRTYHTRRGD
jgi:hypothetical protein